MCVSLPTTPYLTLWCALDTTTPENGALYVQRGSHNDPVSVEAACGYGGVSEGGELIAVNAGSVVLMDARLRHRSSPNLSKNTRYIANNCSLTHVTRIFILHQYYIYVY